MTVYIDSVFGLNVIADYLLLLVTARLAGIPLRRRRYVLAALLGGGYAAAVFLPGLAFFAAAPVKIAAGILLALAAYGGEAQLLRLTLLWFAVSCGFAGAVFGLGFLLGGVPMVQGIFFTDVDVKVLAAAFSAGYLLLAIPFRAAASHGVQGKLLPVRLGLYGKYVELTALWDSGNALREPTSGQSVLVLAPEQLDAVLPDPVRKLLTPERLSDPAGVLEPLLRVAPELRPQLLPYRAVGTAGGLLLTIRLEQAFIAGEAYVNLRAALSPTALGNGYGALWGGTWKRGGSYEAFGETVEKTSGAAGAAS